MKLLLVYGCDNENLDKTKVSILKSFLSENKHNYKIIIVGNIRDFELTEDVKLHSSISPFGNEFLYKEHNVETDYIYEISIGTFINNSKPESIDVCGFNFNNEIFPNVITLSAFMPDVKINILEDCIFDTISHTESLQMAKKLLKLN